MNFLKNKKILITGHTGFQGYWLSSILLSYKVNNVSGISLRPKDSQSKLFTKLKDTKIFKRSIFCDISNKKNFFRYLNEIKPDVIFHLASQPLVDLSYKNTSETFNSNITGSINLLEWLKGENSKIVVVFITSDKCYLPSKKPHIESDPLGGLDPYSASKSIQEILVKSYIYSFFSKKNNIKISTARSGNIYGGGDFTEGRLVPDIMINSFNNKKVKIRNPNYTRPWQYVMDSINGYLELAKYLQNTVNPYDSFNFGPNDNTKPTSVLKVMKIINKIHGRNKTFFIQNKNNFKENKQIELVSKRANQFLNWENKINLQSGLKDTYDWYYQYYNDFKNIIEFTKFKIFEYYS